MSSGTSLGKIGRVGVVLLALAAAVSLRGHTGPLLDDFSVAFLSVAAVAALAPLLSLRFDKDAGVELSGHRDRPPKPRLAAAE